MSTTRLSRRRTPFSRVVFAAASSALAVGCGAARPVEPEATRDVAAPRPVASTVPPSRQPLLPPEQPLTPAEFVLLTDEPLFRGELGTELFALGPGHAGFLGRERNRAVATLRGVRVVEGPGPLEELCLAADGKTTFAVSNAGGAAHVYRADHFDGPLVSLGKRLTHRNTNVPNERAWVTSDERGTFLVDCKSGSISRIGERATGADLLAWNEALTVFRLVRDQHVECILVAGERWSSLPACEARSQADDSIVLETRKPPWAASFKPRCLKAFSADGKAIACGAKVGARAPWRRVGAELVPWQQARYFAPGRVAIPASDGSIVELTQTPIPSEARRLSPAGLVQCSPMLPTAPLFRCRSAEGALVIARIDRDGSFREELRRTFGANEREAFHVTVDGGVAIAGTCEGALEQAACVRRTNGKFHTIHFSPELVTALTRTAPMTKLVPTPGGELYVGIGALEGGITGRVSIKLFKADSGPGVAVENVPTWMLGSLAGLGEMFVLGGSGAFDLSDAFSLGYSRADSIRLWPFARLHPAFRTQEQCRIDLTLQGEFEVACEQGNLHSVGRVGILRKRAGEFFETLDAGGTWSRLAPPFELDATGMTCTALGCRFGPYFRRGWGPSQRR